LNYDPDKRWASLDLIKNSRWLRNVNWKYVEERRNKVSYQPNLYHSYIVEELKGKQYVVEALNQY